MLRLDQQCDPAMGQLLFMLIVPPLVGAWPASSAASWSPVTQMGVPAESVMQSCCVLTFPKLPTAEVND